MRVQIKQISEIKEISSDTVVLPFFNDLKKTSITKKIDALLKNDISRYLKSDDFKGELGKTGIIISDKAHFKRIVIWGLGEKKKLNKQLWTNACDKLTNQLKSSSVNNLSIISDLEFNNTNKNSWYLQQFVTRLVRGLYIYTKTKKSNEKKESKLKQVTFINLNKKNKNTLNYGLAIGNGINKARELGNLPANICTPKYLSSEARKLSKKYSNIRTTIFNEKKLKELKMNSLLSVGNGSHEESQFIIMKYDGGKRTSPNHVLIGKGITFDTGGISLKPSNKMDEMKFDMCGAASVLGTMHAIAEMKLPINVIGVIAAAENMPSSKATKPGDVVTSMSGKTIEILNTDAEGRLVLCDALTYVERFKPKSVIDIATLTGACVVALGHHASGLMSNNDELAQEIINAGQDSNDRVWQLPLWDEYKKQLNSPFADLANIGVGGAGTITAACFLSEFAKNYPWAHLDIAGTAWNQDSLKSASGRPVNLLCQYLIRESENK